MTVLYAYLAPCSHDKAKQSAVGKTPVMRYAIVLELSYRPSSKIWNVVATSSTISNEGMINLVVAHALVTTVSETRYAICPWRIFLQSDQWKGGYRFFHDESKILWRL